MMHWSWWAKLIWLALTAAVVAYELWTNFNGSPKTPTLTDVTVKYIPWWITIPFICWLLIHFILNYGATKGWASKGILNLE